ncbi:MAG: glycosyltransferase family 2 protein [Acidobacteriota bacterium]
MLSGLSVVIPVFDGRPVVADCLAALLAQTCPPVEIVVVDDASSDGSASWIEHHVPQVTVVRNPHNLGFPKACNVGLEQTSGAAVAILNQDASVDPRWAEAMLEAFRSDPSIGIVGGLGFASDGELSHAGGTLDARCQAHHRLELAAPPGSSQLQPAEFVTGASLAISRAALDEVGGLDEAYSPAYYEDVDWCFRVRAAGWRVVVAYGVLYTHLEESRLADGSADFAVQFHRNRLRFAARNLDDPGFEALLSAELEALERREAAEPWAGMPQVLRVQLLDTYWGSELWSRGARPESPHGLMETYHEV